MNFDDKLSTIMNTFYLKSVPENLVKLILKTQCDLKVKKGVAKYSQSQTIVHMLNEYEKLLNKNKK